MSLIVSVIVTALAAIIVCSACPLPAEPPGIPADVEAGKRAFVAFDFHGAQEKARPCSRVARSVRNER